MTQPFQAGQATFLDLSARAKFRVNGTNRFRFLNGQITNDVRKASETVAIEACVLNAKGKMNAHIFISAAPDCYWVDADPALRETLLARLERYVIADDVQIEDVTNRLAIFHVLSSIVPTLRGCRIVSVRRFTEPGWDIWSDAALHEDVLQQLAATFGLL